MKLDYLWDYCQYQHRNWHMICIHKHLWNRVLWWPDSRIPLMEKHVILRGALEAGPHIHSLLALSHQKSCYLWLLPAPYPLSQREGGGTDKSRMPLLCLYGKKKILVFCSGPRGHSEITSSPIYSQPTLSLLGNMKTIALLSHLVSFPLKFPSLSQQHWMDHNFKYPSHYLIVLNGIILPPAL